MAQERIVVTAIGVLLLFIAILIAAAILQLRGVRRVAAETRALVAKMDWAAMLFNNVQQLKAAVEALLQIDKRLQKLEAIGKVRLSNTCHGATNSSNKPNGTASAEHKLPPI